MTSDCLPHQAFLRVGGEDATAEFAKLGRMGLQRALGVGTDKRCATLRGIAPECATDDL